MATSPAVAALKIFGATAAVAQRIDILTGNKGVDWKITVPLGAVPLVLNAAQESCQIDSKGGVDWFKIFIDRVTFLANRIEAPFPPELQTPFALRGEGCNIEGVLNVVDIARERLNAYIADPINLGDIAECLIDGSCRDFVQDLMGLAGPGARQAQKGVEDIFRSIEKSNPEVHSDIVQRISAAQLGALSGIDRAVTAALERISSGITNGIDATFAAIEGVTTKIGEALDAAVSEVVKFVGESVRAVVDPIVEFTRNAIDTIARIGEKVFASIIELVGSVQARINELVDTVAVALAGFARDVTDSVLVVADQVRGFIDVVIQTVAEILADVQRSVTAAIDALVGLTSGVINALAEKAQSIADTVRALPGLIFPIFQEAIGKPLLAIPKGITDSLGETLLEFLSGQGEQSEQVTQTALLGEQFVARQRTEFREIFANILPQSPILRLLLNLIIGVFVLFQITNQIATAQTNVIMQEYSITTPTQIFPAGDAARAVHYGLLDRSEAIMDIRRQGFGEQDAATLLDTQEARAPETEMLAWWLRGLMGDDEIDKQLTAKGFNEADRERWRQASFFIPPVADLISMAVREAFSPEIAERFGQFEDFPPQFAEFALKQGVTEDWARRYWAAHWALPSVQMGFEMLHRRVITEEELSLLLRAQDVMPFWRDKLVQISFSPLTRVDIRRMNKVGVLSLDDVRNAYLDIGYSTKNADRLTAFTEEINRSATADDTVEILNLTKSNIVNFFKDGIITRPNALALFIDLGFTENVANLFLDSAELDLERAERSDSITLILEQSNAGILSFIEAQTALDALELETIERDRAIAKLIRQEASRNQLPARSDLDKMLTAGLIGEAEYIDTMNRRGFSTKWARNFLELARQGGASA